MKKKIPIVSIISILMTLVLVIIIIYGGLNGWFKINITNITNTTIIEKLQREASPSSLCSLTITPTILNDGDSATGTIRDGANTDCELYANEGTGWWQFGIGRTNNDGFFSLSDILYDAGTYNFRAICGECVTNIVTVIVLEDDGGEDGGDGEEGSYECYDSDASLPTWEEQLSFAGFCTDATGTYSDVCVDGEKLAEYYCGPLSLPPEEQHCLGSPAEGYQNCPGWIEGSVCSLGKCIIEIIDSDGDGYSDTAENNAGTNPNDPNSYPNGPVEECVDTCKNLNYAGSYYYPSKSESSCLLWASLKCPEKYSLPFQSSLYLNPCCCFDCVGW